MSASTLTIHIDGAARGNPGPAAFAYVIADEAGAPLAEHKECLGRATNNVAEYTALVRALERARQLGARRLRVFSDSELLVKQMNGVYRVKNPELQVLNSEAAQLRRGFESATIAHVPRAKNSEADRLCNEALDGESRPASPAPRSKRATSTVSADRARTIAEEAVACLQTAADAWARGNPDQPPAEDVWEQLWSILEEHGVVRGGTG
jgi:ribonuclease HI